MKMFAFARVPGSPWAMLALLLALPLAGASTGVSSPISLGTSISLCTDVPWVGNCSLSSVDNPPCEPGSLSNLSTCDCLIVNGSTPGGLAEHAIDRWNTWERTQAWIQLVTSLTSLALSLCFMLTFAIWPGQMLRYPLTLAFWSYFCDLFVSLQFAIVAFTRLNFAYTPGEAWILTSTPSCICAFDASHPGCVCDSGILSLMLQAGLVGSVAFYCALAHNFYRSVADPFTRPRTRATRYFVTCFVIICALSIPYVIPAAAPSAKVASAWVGFGYRRNFLMCWSPERVGEGFLDNPQNLVTATLPIIAVWTVGPVLHLYTRRLVTPNSNPNPNPNPTLTLALTPGS